MPVGEMPFFFSAQAGKRAGGRPSTPLPLPAPVEKKNLREGIKSRIKLNGRTPGRATTPLKT